MRFTDLATLGLQHMPCGIKNVQIKTASASC